MSKLILFIASSLDGYIARKDGDVEWLGQFQTEAGDKETNEFMNSIGSYIMGSKTYEFVLKYGGVGNSAKGKKPKILVLTNRELEKVKTADVEFIAGDITKAVNYLKENEEKDIWLMGGGLAVATLLNQELIDEIILFVLPVLLNEGIPLFPPHKNDVYLTLLESQSYEKGLVKLHYMFNH